MSLAVVEDNWSIVGVMSALNSEALARWVNPVVSSVLDEPGLLVRFTNPLSDDSVATSSESDVVSSLSGNSVVSSSSSSERSGS